MYSKELWALGTNRSVIRELNEYGQQQAKLVGPENVYNYTIGNPSIPAPPEVNEAVIDILRTTDSVEVHSYGSAIGDPDTRQAIAEDLNRRYAAGVRAQDLFICCGSSPALTAIFSALQASPDSEILAIAPYFPEYKPFSLRAGCKFAVVPADTENFQIDLDALEAMLTPNTQAVVVNSPNNPAGTVYTADTIRALGKLLTRKGEAYGHPIYIVADEPYRELVYDGVEAPFIPNLYPHTIVSYSYSKSLSLPGERIGYIYVPQQAADSAGLYAAIAGAARAQGHICAPTLWQKVITRCTGLRPDLESYNRNRRALYDALLDMGYRVAKPDGAFYLFVQAPNGDDMVFAEFAKKRNILVVPGVEFGCPGWVRICYCVSHDLILRSLPAFRALMEEIQNS